MASTVNLPDAPLMVQGVTAPGYSALELRRLAATELDQEGVEGSGDYKVTSGGAAKTLVVATGEAGVDGDSVSNQGRYYQRNSAAQTLDLAIAPDATNPRIDQLVLEIKDDVHDGSGLNVGRLRVVSGTATGGATLDNRTGAAALPATCIRLADVLVPAAYNAAFVQNTHIRDRRPWARGACATNNSTSALATGMGTTFTNISSLAIRVETTGKLLRVIASTAITQTGGFGVDFAPTVDATGPPAVVDGGGKRLYGVGPTGVIYVVMTHLLLSVAAGSHLVSFGGNGGSASGTTTIGAADAARPTELTVEEVIRPNAWNTGA